MADWCPLERLSDAGKDIVLAAKEASARVIEEGGNPGWAMRGMVMARAEAFEPAHLDRGLENTLRAVRNAFDERR